MTALVVLLVASSSYAQVDQQNSSAEADTTDTRQQEEQEEQEQQENADENFFLGFKNVPKAGIKTSVTSTMYYSEFTNIIDMAKATKMTNKASFSWSDFRQQVKTTEKRNAGTTFLTATSLPFVVSMNASRDWKEDLTVNAAGDPNTSVRDYKTGGINLSKPKLIIGDVNLTLKGSAGANEQRAVSYDQRNDFNETYVNGGMQVGTELTEGISVAGRLFGRSSGGDRSLGDMTAPSAATADTMGVGVYYDRQFSTGRVSLTRGNFNREFLDYKRDDTGQVDTLEGAGMDNVVDEMEIKDALTIELENEMRLLGMTFGTTLSHKMDESDYTASQVGYKQKQEQKADFILSFEAGQDSFSIGYKYLWKWDDQLTKIATINRGRQYRKDRELKLFWRRELFRATKMTMRFGTGLNQDTAENGYVDSDKDNLRSDFSVELKRAWSQKFSVSMLFAYKQNQSLALSSKKSANNNIKDSFEISPNYSWPVAPWLTFSQSYRLYIQYTDYVYSQMESVSREDSYNKRGNLTTNVKIKASKRLELNIKHDYNKRYNANRTNEGAIESSAYFVNQKQNINKIDFAFVFKVSKGVTLEGSTFSTRDEKTSIGVNETVSERLEGKIWVGTRVSRKWGTNRPLELSAMIKKHNAYGPSISESSADYWESDIWLKWEF